MMSNDFNLKTCDLGQLFHMKLILTTDIIIIGKVTLHQDNCSFALVFLKTYDFTN
jgi:hypothetical protein